MPFLVVQNPSTPVPARDLASVTEVSIGRAPDNDMVLDDNQVSRKHALLFRINDLFFMKDRGSSFGTFVNGQKIDAPVEINLGDKIGIGGYNLAMQETDKPAAAAPAKPKLPPPPPRPPPPPPPDRRRLRPGPPPISRSSNAQHASIPMS